MPFGLGLLRRRPRPPGVSPVTFLRDTFIAANGTVLTAHVGEVGAAWALHTAIGTGSPGQISSNRFWSNGAPNAYRASGTPRNADYYVEGVFTFIALNAADNNGIAGRMVAGVNTCYYVRYREFNVAWELFKMIAGTPTQLGSYGDAFNSGTRVCRLDMHGSTIRVLIDGVERISAIDSDITAKGFAGISCANIIDAISGRHIDQITAVG